MPHLAGKRGGGRLRARGGDGSIYCMFAQYFEVPIMTMLDRPPPTLMSAARIRELYARNPSPEGCALAGEIWRLQRVLIALEAGMRNAASLCHRQDVIDHVTGLLEYIQGEPCLTEPLAVKQRRKRGERR